MAITPDGWFDWAERRPGPADKVYSTPCLSLGIVPHSQVGYQAGAEARLFSADRNPDGSYTAYAAASWTGSVLYDGTLRQHYPIEASCWTSGARIPNTRFNAFETEGGPPSDPSEPLRPAQVDAYVRIIRDLSELKGWEPRRPVDSADVDATLYEHNECTRWGAVYTACPSGRIPWDTILSRLNEEEDDMSAENVRNLENMLIAMFVNPMSDSFDSPTEANPNPPPRQGKREECIALALYRMTETVQPLIDVARSAQVLAAANEAATAKLGDKLVEYMLRLEKHEGAPHAQPSEAEVRRIVRDALSGARLALPG